MARVKGGNVSKNRRRKVLKAAKGYFGSKHRLYRTAQEQVFHSGAYAYRDRRRKKRDFRKLWITRINAACRMNDISYSKFMNGLAIAGIEVNRKVLAELAVNEPANFTKLVEVSKKSLASGAKKATKVVVKEEKKVAPKKEVANNDLSSKTLAELKEMAKEKDIKGFSGMKKAELVEALS